MIIVVQAKVTYNGLPHQRPHHYEASDLAPEQTLAQWRVQRDAQRAQARRTKNRVIRSLLGGK